MNPELIPALMMALGFAGMAILALKCMGQLVTVRKKLLNAETLNRALTQDNDSLRRQIEKDRNVDRASRGDYGTVYNASYKEIRQSKKTGQWYAVREVEVNP
jgi:hypothetical protein